jgi:hypothetical protein
MAKRFDHLRIGAGRRLPFKSPGGGPRPPLELPERPPGHSKTLATQIKSARRTAERVLAKNRDLAGGFHVSFQSDPDYPLAVDRLEHKPTGIRLLSTTTAQDGSTVANLFVPFGGERALLRKLEEYDDPARRTVTGKPRNRDLVESTRRAMLTVAEAMWTSDAPLPARKQRVWWEVWLWRGKGEDAEAAVTSFQQQCKAAAITLGVGHLSFEERVVVLAHATLDDLTRSTQLLGRVAELRKPSEATAPYLDLSPAEQSDWVDDLLGRCTPPPKDAPSVCVLDTGVDREHPLLAKALSTRDCQAVDDSWGPSDHHDGKHGTLQAGNSLYGDLAEALCSSDPVVLKHRLESVKLVPPPPRFNPKRLYGDLTQQALSKAATASPKRARVGCLALTADPVSSGRPSSWSAAIDQAIFHQTSPLVLCVAAGNLAEACEPGQGYGYPDTNLHARGVVLDPAQSWNSLVVGAMAKDRPLTSPGTEERTVLGLHGGLCPTSRTSVAWEDPESRPCPWPYKPDIVLDGGNYLATDGGLAEDCADLRLLSTTTKPHGRLLGLNGDTSAATALASRMAARLWAQYPGLWAETVRGLLIHSAEWTPAMLKQVPGSQQVQHRRRLRTFGFGTPSLTRARDTLSNRVTLISEDIIQPFRQSGSKIGPHEMVVYDLPWPAKALTSLGGRKVKCKVTLSYFVDPSPGVSWSKPGGYASHGLRFDLRQRGESTEEWCARLSREFWTNDERPFTVGSDDGYWMLGRLRARGSIVSDSWFGAADELAERGAIAVTPIGGWWRERHHLGRANSLARFSLIVTIDAGDAEVDLLAEIMALAETPIRVSVPA